MRAAELHRLARALRGIALVATGNVGDDRVNSGELAVLEDVARHPGATISEVTRRTGLAQSLVSRITHAMATAGAVIVRPDAADGRKVRVELEPRTRAMITKRAGTSISAAVIAATPNLSPAERRSLEHHLTEAERLLRTGVKEFREPGG